MPRYLKEYFEEMIEEAAHEGITLTDSCESKPNAPLELKYKDAKMLPKKYQRVTVEADKKLLREEIKNGVDVSKWCQLGEK